MLFNTSFRVGVLFQLRILKSEVLGESKSDLVFGVLKVICYSCFYFISFLIIPLYKFMLG